MAIKQTIIVQWKSFAYVEGQPCPWQKSQGVVWKRKASEMEWKLFLFYLCVSVVPHPTAQAPKTRWIGKDAEMLSFTCRRKTNFGDNPCNQVVRKCDYWSLTIRPTNNRYQCWKRNHSKWCSEIRSGNWNPNPGSGLRRDSNRDPQSWKAGKKPLSQPEPIQKNITLHCNQWVFPVYILIKLQ